MSVTDSLRRVGARLPIPLLVGAGVAALVFGPMLPGPEAHAPGAGFSVWGKRCHGRPTDLSPEQWTRLDDANRIKHGRYADPIPLQCIIGSYRTSELARYAEAGDPVAQLAVVYSRLKEAEDACTLLPEVRPALEAIYAVKRADYVVLEDELPRGRRPKARVPEAAVVLSQLEQRCGDEARGGELLAEAYRLGFDTRYFGAERPDLR